MDPYQGLKIGDAEDTQPHFLDDLGLGLPGIGIMIAGEWATERVLRGRGMKIFGRRFGGVEGLLKGSRAGARDAISRTFGPRMTETQVNTILHRRAQFNPSSWAHGAVPMEVRQHQRLKRDLFAAKRGKRYSFRTAERLVGGKTSAELAEAYGTRTARRLAVGVQPHRFFRMAAMVSIGAGLLQMGSGAVRGFMNWEPSTTTGPAVEMGGHFADTRTARTMRQSSLQAIHNSGLQARAALGNEASLMHY